MNIDEYIEIDVLLRKIYLINPQQHNFTGLLSCLQYMEPQELEYYVDGNDRVEYNYRIQEAFKNKRVSHMQTNILNGSTLILRGKYFEVECFVDASEFACFLNSMYLYIFREPIFKEKFFGSYTLLIPNSKKSKKIINLFRFIFNRGKYSYPHGRFEIKRGGINDVGC